MGLQVYVMGKLGEKKKVDMRENWKIVLVCLLLAAAVFALYSQVADHPFIWLDDKHYISNNNYVNEGFSLENLAWSFKFSQFGEKTYWHPFTWISHMLDCQLFGLNAGLHHLSNVLHHAINAILLFLALRLMTGSLWRSAFAASLFALHPVNVDTVAWLAERKNLLSTSFWVLTMIAYWFYTQKVSAWRYCLVAVAFCLGLLSKPMLITLPCTLILLDYWPLNRIWIKEGQTVFQAVKSRDFMKLALEKVPLLAISFVFGLITVHSLAVTDQFVAQPVPMGLRIENAIVSYAIYLSKLVWPTGLTIFHPFPILVPAWKAVASLALLLAITTAAVLAYRKLPYLVTGWLWFLGTFVTVIGVVQGGLWPAYAERWAYVPYIGLFVAIAWLGPDLLRGVRHKAMIMGALAFIALGSFSAISWHQIGYWKDDYTLFRHSLDLDPFNYLSHSALASHYIVKNDYDKAVSHFAESLVISPGNPYIMYEQANLLVKMGKKDDAIRTLQDALRSKPNHIDARLNLGNLLLEKGELDQAIEHYDAISLIDPGNTKAYNNLGNAYLQKSDMLKAAEYFRKALQIQPDYTDAQNGLKRLEESQSRYKKASAALEREVQADPGNPALYLKLAGLKQQLGDAEGAMATYRKVLSINPDSVGALYGLALIHAGRQEYGQAIESLQAIRNMQPSNPENYYNLACIYARWNKPDEAVSWLRQAIDHGFGDLDLIRRDPDLAGIKDTDYVRNLMAQGSPAGK